MKVTILGGGSWGTTMAHLLTRHNDTLLWARGTEVVGEINEQHTNAEYLPGYELNPQLQATDDIAEAVSRAEVVIMAVPSAAMRSTAEVVSEHIRPWTPIVSLAKGLESDSHLRMTQVIGDVLPTHPVAALTGPNLAREIMAGQAAASVIASEDQSVAFALQKVFNRGLFRTYVHHDVTGCELGGALKNVVAIATGIAQGLGVGDNTRSMVMTRGLSELTRLGTAMGGEPATFAGLAGMGDLMATCMSPQSRNRTLGEKLGAGKSLEQAQSEMNMVAEGVRTALLAHQLAEEHDVEMPIHEEIYNVVIGEQDPSSAYRGLQIEPGHESQPG